jgi:hypothetical protein
MPKIIDITNEMANGLRKNTKEDNQCQELLMSSAKPFQAHWFDTCNTLKSFQWDATFEQYCQRRANMIRHEGWEKSLPWNLYRELGLQWLDGYNFAQRIGNCCGHAHKNALKASNLQNSLRSGLPAREIALCVAYGIARGNGRMNMGSGLNLAPMARWAAEVGNFWTADFGRYNGGQGRVRQWTPNSQPSRNALETQSIVVHLPGSNAPTFNHVFMACSAGFGINMGTHTFPTSAVIDSNTGLAVPNQYRNGGHAMGFIAACTVDGRRFIYLENSHGARYVRDRLWTLPGNQHGCWIDENHFGRMAPNSFRFGRWYVALCELGPARLS